MYFGAFFRGGFQSCTSLSIRFFNKDIIQLVCQSVDVFENANIIHLKAEISLSQITAENHTDDGPMEADLSTGADSSMDLDLSGKASDLPSAPDKPATEPPDLSKPQRRQQGGYECKYCPFSTQNLNTFKEHVDANHPNVILNPLYLCAVCNFNTKKFDTLTEHNERCHPGESNFKFKRIKMNNQTILEQTIEGCSNNAVIYNTSSANFGKGDELGTLPLSRPAAVKVGKPKMSSDNKRTDLGKLTQDLAKKPITALNVNGTVIIPESTLLKADGLSHIMPSLQRPLNYTQVRMLILCAVPVQLKEAFFFFRKLNHSHCLYTNSKATSSRKLSEKILF